MTNGSGSPIRLEVLPQADLARVLRLAASGAASLHGYALDEIENIKIAVSEAFLSLVERGAAGPVRFEFTPGPAVFVIRGRAAIGPRDELRDGVDVLALCHTVLDAVSDVHGIEFGEHDVHIWAEVRRKDSS